MANMLKTLFSKRKVIDLSILAVAVVAIQYILSAFVYPMFGKATQTLFAITPTTGISGTIGDKVLGVLSGIASFDLGNLAVWVSLFIGAFVLLLVGMFVYEQKWAWKGKNITQRLWAILMYGSAALYVVLLVMKMDSLAIIALPLLVGVAINYFVISAVITLLAKQKAFQFLRI